MYEKDRERVEKGIVRVREGFVGGIVGGKVGKGVEFGMKVDMSVREGWRRVE